MPVFNNIPGTIKQELLAPIDLSESSALLRAQIRNIGNSAAKAASYVSFLRQEFRSILHPRANGLLGLTATNKTDDIDVQLVGNPIPKIIFGGTNVDIAVVLNQDAFRVVLERDASEDGATVEGWILAVVPYSAFDKLPFGGFLIYLIRRIDDILVQTSALTRYETKMTKLPVNSVGIGRHDTAPERPEEAEIVAPVAKKAPVAPATVEPQQEPEPVAEVAPAPEPEPEPVAEPEPEKTDKEDENYKAAASFSLSNHLRDPGAEPTSTHEPVKSYANFYRILMANAKEINKFAKKIEGDDQEHSFAANSLKNKSGFLFVYGKVHAALVSLKFTAVEDLKPTGNGKRSPSFPVHAEAYGYSTDSEQKPLGTWNWSADYSRLNALQIVEKIKTDLSSALEHASKALSVGTSMGAPSDPAEATASKRSIPELIQDLKNVFIESGSYEDEFSDLEVELLDGSVSTRDKLKSLERWRTQLFQDRDNIWVDTETGDHAAVQKNDDMLKNACHYLIELSFAVKGEGATATASTYKEPKEEAVKHPALPTEVKTPKAIPEVDIYKKKLAEMRKKSGKDDTNESAYKKLDVKEDPKVKQDKPKDLKVPEVESTLPTTVSTLEAEIGKDVPVAEDKSPAKLPKGLEAKASDEPSHDAVGSFGQFFKLLAENISKGGAYAHAYHAPEGKATVKQKSPTQIVLSVTRDGYTASAELTTDETVGVFKNTPEFDIKACAEGNSECKRAGVLAWLPEYNDLGLMHVVTRLTKKLEKAAISYGLRHAAHGEATAAEFDEDYTASAPVDTAVGPDKNLTNPDEVAEGTKDEESEVPSEPAPKGEDVKVDINTALKFRMVTAGADEADDVTVPSSLTGFLDGLEEASYPDNVVVFVTSGEGLKTLITSKFRTGKGLRVYSSDLLVPERAAGESKDEAAKKTIKSVADVQDDRVAALRQIDELFDAYEALVKEDSFVAENFDDTDDDAVYAIPDDVAGVRSLLESYAKASSEDDESEEEDDSAEDGEAAFASALAEVLTHKANPTEAAAHVAAILSAYASDASSAFSAIESAGLFASASSFPVMETKWYKRGGKSHQMYHMSVASSDQQTLMYIPRTGAYAVASLEEFTADEARG